MVPVVLNLSFKLQSLSILAKQQGLRHVIPSNISAAVHMTTLDFSDIL